MADLDALTQAALLRFLSCRVDSRDRVIILASTANDSGTVEAYRRAAILAGTDPLLVTYLERARFSGLPQAVVKAASEADVIADLNPAAWANTPGHSYVVRSLSERNGRWVWPVGFEEEHANFLRTPPEDRLVMARFQTLKHLIDGVRQLRVASPSGTNLIIPRGNPTERISSAPLYWTNGGVLAFAPPEEGAEGTVALVGVLRIQSPRLYERQITTPLRFNIRRGRLTGIEDSSTDARFLRDWLDSLNGGPSLQLTKTSIGFDHRSILHALDDYAHYAYFGGILLQFRTDSDSKSGNPTGQVEMLLIGSSCWIDGAMLIENGSFTEESGLLNPSPLKELA